MNEIQDRIYWRLTGAKYLHKGLYVFLVPLTSARDTPRKELGGQVPPSSHGQPGLFFLYLLLRQPTVSGLLFQTAPFQDNHYGDLSEATRLDRKSLRDEGMAMPFS